MSMLIIETKVSVQDLSLGIAILNFSFYNGIFERRQRQKKYIPFNMVASIESCWYCDTHRLMTFVLMKSILLAWIEVFQSSDFVLIQLAGMVRVIKLVSVQHQTFALFSICIAFE